MSRAAARIGATLLGLAVAVAAGRAAVADDQDEGRVLAPDGGGRAPAVTVAARWALTPERGGGWGFVCLDVRNDDAVPRSVRLEAFDDWGSGPDRGRARRAVEVPARGRVRTWLPLTAPEAQFVVARTAGAEVRLGGYGRSGWGPILVVRDGPAAMERFAEALSAASIPGYRARSATFSTVEASMLPPTPAWLTAATLIVVDGSAAGLDDGERQQTLVRWMRLGGTLVVLARGSLPRGPLRDALEVPPAGFGRLLALDEPQLSAAEARRVTALWLTGREDGEIAQAHQWPTIVRPAVAAGEEIPGLGDAPVQAFFLILLAFAIVVGPVAYLVLKRRRRLTAMVWVVPALGTVFALAILGYGVVAEGFGTRGVVRTFSVLDQRGHTCATLDARTLFSGWSPSDVPLGHDAAAWSVAVGDSEWRAYRYPAADSAGARVDFDVDVSTVDGSILPSRTVTPITLASEGRARERLTFRRRPDGGLDVGVADGFAPIAGRATIVLRDPSGAYFVGDGDGPLRPATAADAALAYDALRRADGVPFDPLGADDDGERGWPRSPGYGGPRSEALDEFAAWCASKLPPGLAPGTYLARTTRTPLAERLGLDVAWVRSVHLVVGVLAEGDIDG